MDKKFDIFEVIDLLKDNYVFILVSYPKRIIKKTNNGVCIISENSSYKLDTNSFFDLFKNESFYMYEEDKNSSIEIEENDAYYITLISKK